MQIQQSDPLLALMQDYSQQQGAYNGDPAALGTQSAPVMVDSPQGEAVDDRLASNVTLTVAPVARISSGMLCRSFIDEGGRWARANASGTSNPPRKSGVLARQRRSTSSERSGSLRSQPNSLSAIEKKWVEEPADQHGPNAPVRDIEGVG